MAAQTSSAQVLPAYGFFTTFPRELRNTIYDHLYQEVEHLESEANFGMRIRAPIPSLRLLSRQFKFEYDSQLHHNNQSKLAITQHAVPSEPDLAKCPRLARCTVQLTLNMLACSDRCREGCGSSMRLASIRRWFWRFAVPHLPAVRRLRISLGVFYDSCVNKTLLALDNITSLWNVVEVKLLPCRYSSVETSRGRVSVRHDRHGSMDRFERGGEGVLAIATWTPKGGIVHHREAFEQCIRDRLLGRWSDIAYRRGSWDGTVFPLEAG